MTVIRLIFTPLFAFLLAITLVISLTAAPARGEPLRSALTGTIYVNTTATGADNGTSWTDAFTDLQVALAAAQSGDEIWVATGVYKPGAAREATFQLEDGVALYGGFVGTETALDARDWTANVTVLSGDIDGNDTVDASGVVTDTDNIVGANSYHVVTGNGVTTTAVLDGFIISAGDAQEEDYPHNRGGGMLNDGGSPTLANLLIRGNKAFSTGGGMHNITSAARLTNVTFHSNRAIYGGGLYNVNGSPSLTRVTFQSNRATQEGGGLSNDNGAPALTNVAFRGNSANLGGGLYNANGTPVLTNGILSGNQADRGGALYNRNSSSVFTNVAISGNRATEGGGIYNSNSSLTLQNSILWNNLAVQNLAAIVNDNSIPAIRYSLIQGCNPSGVWNNGCGADDGENLTDVDPLFVATPNPANAPTTTGDLRLQTASPAIDAGDNGAVPAGVTTDLDGNARIFNGVVDLGAYEFQSTISVVYLPTVQNGQP